MFLPPLKQGFCHWLLTYFFLNMKRPEITSYFCFAVDKKGTALKSLPQMQLTLAQFIEILAEHREEESLY